MISYKDDTYHYYKKLLQSNDYILLLIVSINMNVYCCVILILQ